MTTHSEASGPTDLNALPLDALFARLSQQGLVSRLLELARDEDLGSPARDLAGEAALGTHQLTRSVVRAREPAVVCGLACVPQLLDVFGVSAEVTLLASDGAVVGAGDAVCEISGSARGIVMLERTLLNLLGRLSGIATLTRRYAEAIAGTAAKLYDTRKTTPGLRVLEKYAVRCGGGYCHRLGLYDALMLKDNHLTDAAGERLDGPAFVTQVNTALASAARAGVQPPMVIVEVDTLEQFCSLTDAIASHALLHRVDVVLLDNFPLDALAAAAQRRGEACPRLLLEASGGVRLDMIAAIAASGVDRISTGAVTHQATGIDFGLDAVPAASRR